LTPGSASKGGFVKLFGRRNGEEEHEEVSARLDEQDERLKDFAKRLRILEFEVGIHKPSIFKEINGE
jgi:hypothetical protein